ncbi:hypothetical protein niasHT_009808 [Heterodera trifolii]|uniref:Uncharacterized protein n=1 Tax=Heterodera trifolii TaxID=157864 RepID=A0ABD2MDW1_9BILA
MSLAFHFLFFLLTLLNKCSISDAKLLKLRPIFGQSESLRTVRLDVFVRYLDKAENVRKMSRTNAENGQTFVLHLPNVDEKTANFNIFFFFYVKSMKNEYKAGIDDENPSDEGPFFDPKFNLELEEIRTMFRMAYVTLYRPNFSKLYTVNLGQIDPPGLFLNRRVFLEAKDSDDTGIFYAFLHATAKRHQRNGKAAEEEEEQHENEYFLGCAPLLLNKNNGISAQNLTTKNRRKKSEKLFEFELSIPVNLDHLFKHIIWLLNLKIYRLKEKNFGDDCLRLKNWIEKSEKETDHDHPKLVLEEKVLALFDGSQNISRNLFSNPMAELFRIANESSDEFEQRNAKKAIENINENLILIEENVKKMLAKLAIYQLETEENVLKIGKNGIKKNDKIVKMVQRLSENSKWEGTIEKANKIISLIKLAEESARKEATEALESLEMIDEQNDRDKIVVRESDRN